MGEMVVKLTAPVKRILIVTVGTRLKEERIRLGLSQTAFATACGVSKRSQILFEQDEHMPGGAYLAGIDMLGVDLTYVLAGRRERLEEADADILELWRAASATARAAAVTALTAAGRPSAMASPGTVFEDATIGQQFSGDVDLRGQKLIVKAPKRTPKDTR